MCIQSLSSTIHEATKITIIDNASCAQVKEYLAEQFKEGKIDQLIINKENLGKIDPVIAVIRGCHEALLTITDADVLFLPGWQSEVEQCHVNFPHAGTVCPVPISRNSFAFTMATWVFGMFHGKIRYEKILNPEDMVIFCKSISDSIFYKASQLDQIANLKYKNHTACIGAGHFVATYKRKVFDFAPKGPSLKKIDGGIENAYLDKPSDIGGYLRLSTSKNFAYHIGNKPESWMADKIAAEEHRIVAPFSADSFKIRTQAYASILFFFNANRSFYEIFNKVFMRIAKNTFFRKKFCVWLGLKKENAVDYFT